MSKQRTKKQIRKKKIEEIKKTKYHKACYDFAVREERRKKYERYKNI